MKISRNAPSPSASHLPAAESPPARAPSPVDSGASRFEAGPAPARARRPSAPSLGSNTLAVFWNLRRQFPQWYKESPRTVVDPRPWPAGFDPKKAPVYGRNEVVIKAPPDQVFRTLTEAGRWHEFYGNGGEVKLRSGESSPGVLGPGARFDWKPFGAAHRSEVTLFEQDRAIGWTAHGFGTEVYHRWFLEPVPGGTRVVTEEVQKGFGAKLAAPIMKKAMPAAHQAWLEGMKRQLEGER
jgi:uncharacterized protein YndB with AHSA1/START domain